MRKVGSDILQEKPGAEVVRTLPDQKSVGELGGIRSTAGLFPAPVLHSHRVDPIQSSVQSSDGERGAAAVLEQRPPRPAENGGISGRLERRRTVLDATFAKYLIRLQRSAMQPFGD